MVNWIGSTKSGIVTLQHVPTGKRFHSWSEAIAYDESLRS